MDKQEIYADGIGQIHFVGNMVRMDFMTLQPTEEGKQPTPESKVRVILPPQGFLNAYDAMQKLLNKLVEAGVVHKNGSKW